MTWRIGVAFCLSFGVAGCGLALDFGPPDPVHGDGGGQQFDAMVRVDAGMDTGTIELDGAVEEDAVVIGGDAISTGCSTDGDCIGGLCISDCMGGAHCVPNDIPCSQTPTCGCDGVTYDSLCSAYAAHVEAAEDPSICFGCGVGGAPCPIVGELCLGCPGTPPACVRVPLPVCTQESVCGCDGQTYASNCEAQNAGVATYTAGACPGTCVTSLDCSATQYCQRHACGDPIGTCVALGTNTTLLVCGCSGRRYRSTREALRREGALGLCDFCPGRATACCADSNDCGDRAVCIGAGDDCTGGGTCEPLDTLPDGSCWSDEDCAPQSICAGASVCVCGAQCLLPDAPGTCVLTP